jgi:hypothetical protein
VTQNFNPTQGSDVASANDMTLGNGNTFDVTGTTTINTIASKGVGTVVLLQFDGILQLTHSADLHLPNNGDNITTAAGDRAVLEEYASGDWRCWIYQRADGTSLALPLSEHPTPGMEFNDSDDAPGTYTHYINSSGGDNGIVASFGVEIADGTENVPFLQLDGVNSIIAMLKAVTLSDDTTLADTKSIKTETDSSDDYSAWEATDDVGDTPVQVEVVKVTNSGDASAVKVEMGGTTSKAIVHLNATPDDMADDNYNGIDIQGKNCGENLTQWDTVTMKADADIWHQANATAGGGDYPTQGIAVSACTDGNPATILVKGIARNEGWTGLTVGAPVYLGETAGAITQTAPSTSNDCVQIIGWAISDSEIYFDFSRPYQLVE